MLTAIAASVLAIVATVARAVDEVEIHIESARGTGWSAQGLVARLGFNENGERAGLHIDELRLAQLSEPIRNVNIDCPSVAISTDAIGCIGGRVSARWPNLGEQRFGAEARYDRANSGVDFSISGWKIGAGTASLRGDLRDENWNVAANLQNASIETLAKLASTVGMEVPLTVASGAVTLDLNAKGSAANLGFVHAKGRLIELTTNNESGSIATDRLALSFDTSLRKVRSEWAYEVEAHADAGQGYAEPIFLDFGAHAFRAQSNGKLTQTGALIADAFSVDHAGVLQGTGSAALQFEHEQPLRSLDFALGKLQFPGAYESYLQPLLLETNFKSLLTKGSIAGNVSLREGLPRAIDLSLMDLDIDDGSQTVALHSLNGAWHWSGSLANADANDSAQSSAQSATQPKLSQLRWTGGALYGLEFGASSLSFTTADRDFRLVESSRIPLLDGAVQLDALRVRNAGLPSVAFMIDAVVQPVSVPLLCRAFGWPEFGGKLGGAISKLRMREGIVSLGTTLQAQVFDGEVTVSNLRLEQPFGKWPRFHSNIALRNLDLELVTGAFSFGRITGRLSGAIDGLELFKWSPVAFDARLFTPLEDRSRHRISQRAVENIGSIGGGGAGVTAALSSGFLRFFEDFNYARLGITCKLHNEVCEMGGAGPAPNGGYYLVQGRGLPRIDVIGNARRVDWPRLVQQLIAATESGGPVVE
jgi:hypothetical protein